MAEIPRHIIDDATAGINGLSDGMKAALRAELEAVDFTDLAEAERQIVAIMNTYCAGATDAAAVISARLYEECRAVAIPGESYSALVESGRKNLATEKAVHSFFEVDDFDAAALIEKLVGRLDFEVKRAAGDCIFENGKHDKRKPRYARVATGSETCGFCLMLASRGFVYTTANAAGDLNHYHANCDCRVVPSWKGTSLQGYDPQAMYDRWQAVIDDEAKKRAERKGTSEDEERKAIMGAYRRSAESAKAKARGRRALDQTGN